MAKLHEVIAVEASLAATAQKIREEAITTFTKKVELFLGTRTSVTYFAETDQHLNTSEFKAVVESVPAKLKYIAGSQIRAIDCLLQKEATNQHAKADIVIDGVTIASGVPAIVLLRLEAWLVEVRAVFAAIPTLQPGPHWQKDFDADTGGGVYEAEDVDVTFRTKKNLRAIELSPATKEHPAQVQPIQEDMPVAKIEKQHWSAMMSTADKSNLLERCDRLIRGVKKARQRANDTTVVKDKIGAALFDFIFSTEHGGSDSED
jgi:hypothetical protein